MGHIEAPIPDNEEERLRALYQYKIIDTPSEQIFDDIVKLASEVCDTPIALISLVERERQWFKARKGLDATETSRSVSFCAHAILGNNPFVVEDAVLDERFSDNPLVLSDPNIRFYAGIPLITPTGQNLGSLCVIDKRSRKLDQRQMQILQVLAGQVTAQLEVRAQRERGAILQQELEASRNTCLAIHRCVCVAEYDTKGNILSANENFLNLFGYALEEVVGRHDSMLVPYSERRDPSYNEFWSALRSAQCQLIDVRRITKQNSDIWIRSSFTPIKDQNGNVTKIISFAFDITKEKVTNFGYKQLEDAISKSKAVVELDLSGTIIGANENFLQIVGFTDSELKGKHHSALAMETERDSHEDETLWSKLLSGEHFSREFKCVVKDGCNRWLKATYSPIVDMQGRLARVVMICSNNTEQTNLSIELSETIEALYRSSAVIEFNPEGQITRVNDNFLQIVKYGREEVLGRQHSIFVSDDEFKSDAYRRFWEELRKGQFQVGEFRRCNKFGEDVWIRGAYNPICDATGKVYKVIEFTFDATTQKEVSLRLASKNQELINLNHKVQTSEARYKALSEASPLGIYGTTPDGNCTYVNDRYLQISGLSEIECRGRGWLSAIHPHDRDRVDHEWYRAAAENRQYDSIHRFLRKDGAVTWCSVKAAAILEAGQIAGYVGTLEDVTSRKTAENSLKLATSAGKVGVWQLNIIDNSLTWDDSMLAIYGINKSDFVGAYVTWAKALSSQDRDAAEQRLALAIKGEQDFDTVFQIVRPDGSRRFIKAAGLVERDSQGNPLRMVGTNVDITHVKERETELERMRVEAEAATYAKSQFLANMSHEIRTPLTSIIGFAEAAKEPGVSPTEQAKAFETIYRNGKHLLGVINDILDLSKIDAGALKVELLQFSPVAIVENIRTLMVPRLAEKGLSLIVNYKWELPKTISSDSLRLMQVLVNLVSNALKFTEKGHVELSVWCDRENERLHFSITDTGIGLSEEQISRLFEPFSQAEAGTTRKYGGTGLGLSISKQLIERLGGDISVQSKPNVGSTFSFSIKTGVLSEVVWISSVPEQAAEIQAAEKDSRTLRGRVLIADDAADNRKLLEFTLRKTALDLTIVENGVEAVERALHGQFDVILLDMQMPVMDGYTAAREIRRNGINIPIVAFTANTMKHDVLKCIEAGCTTHLPKPFGKDALIECLFQQIENSRASVTNNGLIISELFKNNPEALGIVLDFVDGLEVRMRDIAQAIEEENFAQLEDIAHRLSGSSGLFGYHVMSEIASLLECSAKERQLEEAKGVLDQVKSIYVAIQKGVLAMKASKEKLTTAQPNS